MSRPQFAATAPHALAAEAGMSVMAEGGTAVEAMVAQAAAIAALYPHMNGLGGDNFWLIKEPGRDPIAIDACGAAAAAATIGRYRSEGHAVIPSRGPLAANTVAGAVSGWMTALEITGRWRTPMPLSRLLGAAIDHAETGITVTGTQAANTARKWRELEDAPGFAPLYAPGDVPPKAGETLCNPALAATLRHLCGAGLEDFYRGDLARILAGDLADAGSPIALADLESHVAKIVAPLAAATRWGTLYNFPPPTQGLASLIILALFDRLDGGTLDSFEHVHGLVEVTKRAFLIRDAVVTDPGRLPEDPRRFLDSAALDALAGEIDPGRALPWPRPSTAGDTIWMGTIDAEGRAVSMIQSLYWEFGSGVVSPRTGIVWQNRGCSFSLDGDALNALEPGRKPFHTLNPAMADLNDGRTLVYGTMGGEGQPQTQAAVFTRHVCHGQPLADAIAAPRWLLGRTWGETTTTLKIEEGLDPRTVDRLRAAGHDVEMVPALNEMMGHAGAIARAADGCCTAASDPRSDGAGLVLSV